MIDVRHLFPSELRDAVGLVDKFVQSRVVKRWTRHRRKWLLAAW
jgi:hypothetical protein